MNCTCILIFLTTYFSLNLTQAQVSLPDIFSDNMVLQANRPIRIWGKAAIGENVSVELADSKRSAKTDKAGNWAVEFPAREYGDPITLRVSGKANHLALSNIVIGEVWLCAGQSNMAMTVNGSEGQVYNYKEEEASASYPLIRSFKVRPNISTTPKENVTGTWEICSPETVGGFSGVAYFFARRVHQETGIPIGIINSSWGGTDIETWISADAFQSLPAEYRLRYRDTELAGVENTFATNENNRNAFSAVVAHDIGLEQQWFDPSFDTKSWKQMKQPQEWAQTELAAFDRVVWFKHEISLPATEAGESGTLSLGKIDDMDMAWVNGAKVGETKGAGTDRHYEIPEGLLKHGRNVVVVRVVDAMHTGGFTGKAADLILQTKRNKYSLVGDWQFRPTVDVTALRYEENMPNIFYGLLYNGMVNPLRDFAIRGVIWYQGENNAGQTDGYRTLFPTLITDWRNKWGYDFPFYWVQLPNYQEKASEPAITDSWAELREAQTMTLSLPHTGQAITIDIGEANDIHPRNKQDVGSRLAAIALNKNYDRPDVVCSGPTYKSMVVEGDKIIIEFDNIASGLYVTNKYGYIEGFSIAGSDQRFVWANAQLLGKNKVIVYASGLDKPVAVRFCWSINPDVNLFNSAAFPAGPFRTDSWPLNDNL